MSILEFDEEKEIKLIREDEYEYGYETGREEGRRRYLIESICKKLRKGKEVKTIAEELEEDINVVEEIYKTAQKFEPEYDVEEIVKAKQGK